jgi:hypothetical protein
MVGSCRFIGEEREFADDPQHRKVRGLEITFEDGFIGCIYVTSGEEFEGWHDRLNTWHYELSPDGTKITLKNFKHASSVDLGDGKHHVVIEGWPLLP